MLTVPTSPDGSSSSTQLRPDMEAYTERRPPHSMEVDEVRAEGPRCPGHAHLCFVPGVAPPLLPHHPPAPPPQPLIFMALDIFEEDHGQFTIWGASASGASVLLVVQGFRPYLYVAAPAAVAGSTGDLDWFGDQALRETFRAAINRAMPGDLRVAGVLACDRRPLQYCRPADLGQAASLMLRLEFDPGTSLRRAAPALARSLASSGLLEAGWDFGAGTLYESEIAPLQRFLADVPVSGEGVRAPRRSGHGSLSVCRAWLPRRAICREAGQQGERGTGHAGWDSRRPPSCTLSVSGSGRSLSHSHSPQPRCPAWSPCRRGLALCATGHELG